MENTNAIQKIEWLFYNNDPLEVSTIDALFFTPPYNL